MQKLQDAVHLGFQRGDVINRRTFFPHVVYCLDTFNSGSNTTTTWVLEVALDFSCATTLAAQDFRGFGGGSGGGGGGGSGGDVVKFIALFSFSCCHSMDVSNVVCKYM